MTTIQDVAKYAHVGVGTVSRVLSGKGYVKEETRQKVQDAIKSLDYAPNEMARNLFFRKSGIVAVIVPELSHPFFSELVNGTEVALCARGYRTMICNTFYEKNYEQRYLEMLKSQKVDGIIFAAHTSLDVSQYVTVQRPIVALDRNLGDTIPRVSSDHIAGGRMAAESLIRSGCKNVAQFGKLKEEDKVVTPSNVRHEVFTQMMADHGIPCRDMELEWFFSHISGYQETADQFLENYPEVDGVFGTDMIILSILQAASRRGKKIPEDLKLVSYDGTFVTELSNPPITAVVQSVDLLAETAVDMVVGLIEGNPIDRKIVELPVSLRTGGTTAEI